jgi:hypothetical protein
VSDNPAQQVLSDLFGYLESLETQSGAILRFLTEKGVVTDQQLAPYLEQAAIASSVKWRAARVRMEHLFAVSEPLLKATPTKPETIAKESESASKPRPGDIKAEDGTNGESARASGEKVAADNGQPIKDANARSQKKHEPDRQKADSSLKEESASIEEADREEHRKAS